MALFRRDRDTAATPSAASGDDLSPADAVAGVAIAAMYADGVLGGEEYDALIGDLSGMALFDGLDERGLRDMLVRIEGIVSAHGDDGLLVRCAAAVPERLRGTAYLTASNIVFGDGEVGTEELQFLSRIQKALQLDDVSAKKITDVVRLKHVV